MLYLSDDNLSLSLSYNELEQIGQLESTCKTKFTNETNVK